jgi:TonB family protein
MRSYVTSAFLAAGFVLTPVATGQAPALSQDFSITNQNDSLRIEGAELSPDWIKKLQAFWDLHAWYPKEASDKDESGVVKVHLKIHSDGQIWWVKVEQGSGSTALDNAAFVVFFKQYLAKFPPGTRAREADVFSPGAALTEADVHISLHYVLTHRHDQPVNASTLPALSDSPFTVTNGPVKGAVVETLLQRNCSGEMVTNQLGDSRPDSILGAHNRVTAIFYRKPDGTPWVKWSFNGGTVNFFPVIELGVSAQWRYPYFKAYYNNPPEHYAVWPAGDNHLSGRTVGGGMGPGTIDLTCDSFMVPAISSNSLLEPH